MANTVHLELPLLAAAQAQKHVTHNEAVQKLDSLVQLSVKDRHLTTPPASPSEGDRYIPASGASGAWDNWDHNLAWYSGGAWTKITPKEGWVAHIEDEDLRLVWDGTAWVGDSTRAAYDPPFTGSVRRSVRSRLGDVVSVNDFGARGDGIADDTAALVAADAAAQASGRKLIGGGTYLISSQITLKSESIDFTGATIKLASNFPTSPAIIYSPVGNDLDIRSWVVLNVDGNKANQGSSIIAVRIQGLPSPHTQLFIRGKDCGTVCQVYNNTERLNLWVSGGNCDLVLHDLAATSTPDENVFHISGGACDQFYKREGSTTADVHLNVQSQTSGTGLYPVEILGERYVRLGGIMRSMQNGAVRVALNDAQSAGVIFNNLVVFDANVATAVRIERARVVSGQIVIFQTDSGGVDIHQCSGGNLDIAIEDPRGGIGVKLGDTANGQMVGTFNLRLSYLNGTVGLVALRTERVGGVKIDYRGSNNPIEITDIVMGLYLSVPSGYLTNNVPITVTSSEDPTIEFVGSPSHTDLVNYSYPRRGMRATQYGGAQLKQPVYQTGRGSTGGWQIPDLSDLGKKAISGGGLLTASGNGSAVSFAINHGLTDTPVEVNVTPASADAKGDFWISSVGSSQIVITYAVAPPSGTNNLKWYWRART